MSLTTVVIVRFCSGKSCWSCSGVSAPSAGQTVKHSSVCLQGVPQQSASAPHVLRWPGRPAVCEWPGFWRRDGLLERGWCGQVDISNLLHIFCLWFLLPRAEIIHHHVHKRGINHKAFFLSVSLDVNNDQDFFQKELLIRVSVLAV